MADARWMPDAEHRTVPQRTVQDKTVLKKPVLKYTKLFYWSHKRLALIYLMVYSKLGTATSAALNTATAPPAEFNPTSPNK